MMATESRERMLARLKAKMAKRKQAAVAPKPAPASTLGWKRHVYVTVSNFGFMPSSVVVRRGTVVTWTCCSHMSLLGPLAETHCIQFHNGKQPASGDLKGGDSYTLTFEEAGLFEYCSANHTFVKGSVQVLDEPHAPTPPPNDNGAAAQQELELDLDRIAAEVEGASKPARGGRGGKRHGSHASDASGGSGDSEAADAAAAADGVKHGKKQPRGKRGKKAAAAADHQQQQQDQHQHQQEQQQQQQQQNQPQDVERSAAAEARKDGERARGGSGSHAGTDPSCSVTEGSTDIDDLSEKKSDASSRQHALAALEDFNDDFNDVCEGEDDEEEEGGDKAEAHVTSSAHATPRQDDNAGASDDEEQDRARGQPALRAAAEARAAEAEAESASISDDVQSRPLDLAAEMRKAEELGTSGFESFVLSSASPGADPGSPQSWIDAGPRRRKAKAASPPPSPAAVFSQRASPRAQAAVPKLRPATAAPPKPRAAAKPAAQAAAAAGAAAAPAPAPVPAAPVPAAPVPTAASAPTHSVMRATSKAFVPRAQRGDPFDRAQACALLKSRWAEAERVVAGA